MNERVEQLLQKCKLHSESGEVAAALDAGTRALAAARTAEECCSALALLAYLNMRLGDFGTAEKLASEALETGQQTADGILAMCVLGSCSAYANDIARAETLFRQAEDLSRRLGDTANQAWALHNLAALVYSLRGQFDLALAASAESNRL